MPIASAQYANPLNPEPGGQLIKLLFYCFFYLILCPTYKYQQFKRNPLLSLDAVHGTLFDDSDRIL
jgi:hypothetical protein